MQRRARVVPAPAMTLREYARLTRPLLDSDAFTHLTTLVETILYSAWPVTPGHPPQARDFAARVARDLTARVESEAEHAG